MRTVSVSELKAKLSRYLREVKRGGEVQISERGTPIARLTAIGVQQDRRAQDARVVRLVKAGILGPGGDDASAVLKQPPIVLASGATLSDAISEDREDRF